MAENSDFDINKHDLSKFIHPDSVQKLELHQNSTSTINKAMPQLNPQYSS